MFIKVLKDKYLMISLGAVLGAILSWRIDNIFIVNILGCFILGSLSHLKISKEMRLLISFGLTGSLTSFSSWISNLFFILKDGLYIKFIFNIFLFLLLGNLMFFVGIIYGKNYVNK
tara:strand:+ start:468 stop:815 length:348 start_codon:yes stop_codon:yes gene_type:complete